MPDLSDIFTDEVLAKLESRHPTEELAFRLNVLSAGRMRKRSGEGGVDQEAGAVLRGAWNSYVSAAFRNGMFEGGHGRDLRSRLAGSDAGNSRSAMAECMSAWYLTEVQGFTLTPRPEGRERRTLEYSVGAPSGEIWVEVKAPQRERSSPVWAGDDSDLLQKSLEGANKQFSGETTNLLIVVPRLRLPVIHFRNQLTFAFYGEAGISFLVDPERGGQVGPTRPAFDPSGRFLKPDGGSQRFTRVGGVLCIEEHMVDDQVRHDVLLAHNPHARQALVEGDWVGLPQFVRRGDHMVWSDGADPFVPQTVDEVGLF